MLVDSSYVPPISAESLVEITHGQLELGAGARRTSQHIVGMEGYVKQRGCHTLVAGGQVGDRDRVTHARFVVDWTADGKDHAGIRRQGYAYGVARVQQRSSAG